MNIHKTVHENVRMNAQKNVHESIHMNVHMSCFPVRRYANANITYNSRMLILGMPLT